ncbi:NDR1/HIN1-like protein 13 [Pyrus x bretschneideri]|uniref:NDR1/HIN1-like protein 13 n=1 Tax=Pyrus x bretschneideri TaxID=225117 RepID=UPI0005108AB4|nr:NDR1/HIN1-like protein 13 [Pyrus x bretschneideri]
MADRVHPRGSPSHNETTQFPHTSSPQSTRTPSPPESEKLVPPPGTYVIQIPKDQVYRVPPPENATRYKNYTRQNPRRSSCRCCFCWLFGLVAALILLSAAAAGIFYLVVRPESPNYSIESIAFKGFNLTTPSPSSTISPEIQVTVRVQNPNKKIGIYYGKKNSVKLFYSDVKLCDGATPAFYQPSKNVTEFRTALKGSGIKLTSTVQQGLVDAQRQGKVPLELDIRMPVRIKVGPIKTWTITVKVGCDLTVDKLTTEAKIVSKDCDYSVDPW